MNQRQDTDENGIKGGRGKGGGAREERRGGGRGRYVGTGEEVGGEERGDV